MSHENNIQVKEDHYIKRSYNSLERFISYYYQLHEVGLFTDVKSILEIGPGSKLVSRELQQLGYNVTTCDFDPAVTPDIIADVRSLPCENESFDCIMACQVLEHITYEEFEKVLGDLSNITRKYLLISLPERHTGINIVIKFPFIQTLLKRRFIDMSLRIPVRFPGFKESGQHYWEIDRYTTSLNKVRTSIKRHFAIVKEFNPPLNKYHRFFILSKLT